MPTVKFTSNLKRFFPDLTEHRSEEVSIPGILDSIETRFPGFKDYIIDEHGSLRKHVNIFIGNDLIQDRVQLSDALDTSDELYIMQALSGG
jgi:molybdopterin synthase sulfur carrier subunit